MEKKMEKFYTDCLLSGIRKEIKRENEKEGKNVFIFIKIYVIAMKIVEKKEEQNCFLQKKDIIFSDYIKMLCKEFCHIIFLLIKNLFCCNFFKIKKYIL